MDELATMLQQAGTAAPSAPANDPATGTGGAAPTPQTEAPVPAGQPEADELPASVREYLAANPGAKDVVDLVTRETRSAWTPKLQRAAEVQKMIDGLDPQDIEQLRQIKAAQARDPQAVAKYLREYADSIYSPAPTPPNPYADVQAQTPAEELALKKIAELDQWRQQQEERENRTRLEQFVQHATQELNRLASEYQIEIPHNVRVDAARLAQNTGMPIENALFATNSKAMIEAAARRARDEAAGIVQQKQVGAAGNPGSLTPAQGGPPEPNGKRDFKSIMARELADMGLT